ncbi:alpha/beta hydrolase [Pontibacter toksunensis]|uniref:Alpha/beta hydrolase n=1 Tax=Pontibacter toksunensis TaxID=1332631 RepID=A0ABW6BVT1_9BACT
MTTNRKQYATGRLTAVTGAATVEDAFKSGVRRLNLDEKKDGLIYVPHSYDKKQPAALAVMLHGAGAPAENGLSLLQRYADARNIILLAPASRSYSWDIIATDAFGPDVIFIDQALSFIFKYFAINQNRIAIGGFSDGASYAFCLGLTNGDLFTHIIAFSPGFAYAPEKKGKPAVFISHGEYDPVLPIDSCSRRIVPQLQRQGLEVNYIEFRGRHEVPSNISGSAVAWFTGSPSPSL